MKNILILISFLSVSSMLAQTTVDHRGLSDQFNSSLSEQGKTEELSAYEENIRKALEFIYSGSPRKAFKPLGKALKLDSSRVDAYVEFGFAHLKLEEFQNAGKALDRAIQVDPSSHRAWFLMGDVYLHSRESGLAAAAYEKAIQLSKETRWNYHYKLSLLYRAAKDNAQAKTHMEICVPALELELKKAKKAIYAAANNSVVSELSHQTEVSTGWNASEYEVMEIRTESGDVPEEMYAVRDSLVESLKQATQILAELRE